MKAILSMALVLCVCGLARAADKVDAVGTWKCEYEIGGQKRTSTLAVKKDGEKLTAKELWKKPIATTNYNTPLLKDGHLYAVMTGGGGRGGAPVASGGAGVIRPYSPNVIAAAAYCVEVVRACAYVRAVHDDPRRCAGRRGRRRDNPTDG